MREHVTRFDSGGRIDRHVSFVDVLNNALLIDHESRAISESLLFVEDTIVLNNSAFEVTEQRKRNTDLFCEFAVGGNTVYTQSENLGVG